MQLQSENTWLLICAAICFFLANFGQQPVGFTPCPLSPPAAARQPLVTYCPWGLYGIPGLQFFDHTVQETHARMPGISGLLCWCLILYGWQIQHTEGPFITTVQYYCVQYCKISCVNGLNMYGYHLVVQMLIIFLIVVVLISCSGSSDVVQA